VLGGCEGEEANHSLPMYAFKKFFKGNSRKKKMEINIHLCPSSITCDVRRHLKVLP
jgi:hypothetical protein